jgi:hypothetical protein
VASLKSIGKSDVPVLGCNPSSLTDGATGGVVTANANEA